MRPTTRIAVEEGDAGTLMRLIDALEENDDVQAVHANFDVDADVLERVVGGLVQGRPAPSNHALLVGAERIAQLLHPAARTVPGAEAGDGEGAARSGGLPSQ